MNKFAVICGLFMMLAIQNASCNDFLFVDFDRDGWKDRHYQIKAKINANDGDVDITITYLNDIQYVVLESASSFNKVTWKIAGDDNSDVKIGPRKDDHKIYYFKAERALQYTSPTSPCQRIAQTNDSMCLFRLRITEINARTHSRDWMPIYMKIKNYSDKTTRTVELYGGSFKPSNGHISQYDAWIAENLATSVNLTMTNVTTDNEPSRTLTLNGVTERTSELISQIKAKYIYFDCPKFTKLIPFTKDEVLQKNTSIINLAHLGIPFDANMMCSFSLYFTDIHNELNLIEIPGNGLISVKADPRYLDWETEERDQLKREYNSLVVKYNNILKVLQGVIESNPMRAAPRMLRSLAAEVPGQGWGLKRLVGKILRIGQ